MARNPRNTKTIHVRYESEDDDCTYEGPFKITKLSINGFNKQQIRKMHLNGGYHHDADNPGAGISKGLDLFNDMLAHLEVAVLEAPDWWDLDNITDVGLINAVHKEVIVFENSFPGKGRRAENGGGEVTGSGEASSSGTSQTSQPREDVRAVVDQQVSSPPEP